jgi:hypothetical protein
MRTLPLWLVDVATSVPFGVRSVPADKTRRITCWRGTDEALDLGIGALGLEQTRAVGDEAAAGLRDWLQDGPVLVGPLDMGLLPYVPDASLYRGLDHFVVAISTDADAVHLYDPEYYPRIPVRHACFAAAWRANGVVERRMPNTMRRVRGLLRADMAGLAADALRSAAANLAQADVEDGGGAQAWRRLAMDGPAWCAVPGGAHALAHSLAAQMQRIAMAQSFLDLACAEYPTLATAASSAGRFLADQECVLGRLAGALVEGLRADFGAASLLASDESALVPLFEEMADALRL